MPSDNTRVIRNMRHMAWERAKGELRSMTHTFWGDTSIHVNQHPNLTDKIEAFIKDIEDEGLHE